MSRPDSRCCRRWRVTSAAKSSSPRLREDIDSQGRSALPLRSQPAAERAPRVLACGRRAMRCGDRLAPAPQAIRWCPRWRKEKGVHELLSPFLISEYCNDVFFTMLHSRGHFFGRSTTKLKGDLPAAGSQQQPQVEQVPLEHVVAGARLPRRRPPVRIVILRDDDDLRFGKAGAQAPGRF